MRVLTVPTVIPGMVPGMGRGFPRSSMGEGGLNQNEAAMAAFGQSDDYNIGGTTYDPMSGVQTSTPGFWENLFNSSAITSALTAGVRNLTQPDQPQLINPYGGLIAPQSSMGSFLPLLLIGGVVYLFVRKK